MNRRQLLSSVAGAAVTTVLAGCTSDDETGREDGNAGDSGGDSGSGDSGSSDNESSVKLLDHEWYEEDFSAGVRGRLENTSDEELSYVEVNAYFLDSDGTQIGEGLDNFSELAAGRTAEFDCMFTGDDASRVEEYEVEASVSDY